MYWNGSHDYSLAMEQYKLFRKDRMGRQAGVAIYVREQLEYIKVCLGMYEKSNESLWLRIKERTGDIIAGVCYRSSDQEEQVNQALCRHIGVASYSQALVLLGNCHGGTPELIQTKGKIKNNFISQ